jgi:hypothetical protein
MKDIYLIISGIFISGNPINNNSEWIEKKLTLKQDSDEIILIKLSES